MKKSLKTIVALTGISAFALGVGLMNQTNAVSVMAATSTATDTGFYMETYAGVYDNDTSGISFKTNITKSWYENVLTEYENANRLEFHTLVTRLDDGYTYEDMLYNDADGLVGTRALLDIESPFRIAEESFTDGENTLDVVCYAAAITYDLEESQLLSAYATELTARSYVLIKDETGTVLDYKYAEYNANTCSIKQVANLLILQGNDSENVAKYTNTTFTEVESGGYYLAKAKDGNVAIKVDTLNTVTDVVIDGNRVSADLWTQDGEEIQLGDLSSLDLTAGESYVLAAYDEAADTYYMADFTVPEAYGDAVWYSTADETLYQVKGDTPAVALGGATVTTVDGETVNLSNTTTTEKTTENVLLTVGETTYEASVKSYEKVITQAADLSYFQMGVSMKSTEMSDVLYVSNGTTDVYKNGEKLGTATLDTNNTYGYGAYACIYEGQLVSVFVTNTTNYTTSAYQYKHFGGRYIIANDIDVTENGYTLAASASYAPAATNTNKGVVDYRWCGFQGIFDGNGRTVAGLTVGGCGIFGNVGQNALIKNVSFTNVKFSNSDNTGTLASYLCGQLNNVYIQAEKLPNSNNMKFVGLVAGQINTVAKIENSMFNLAGVGTLPSSSSVLRYGVLCGAMSNYNEGFANNIKCTVISEAPLVSHLQSGTTTTVVASGETGGKVAPYVVRYADVAALTVADGYETLKQSLVDTTDSAAKSMWEKIFAGFES